MTSSFDTLAAAEVIENAGADPKLAKAIAAQLRVASDAGKPVTRPALEAALGALKAELIERIAETEKRMIQSGAETEKRTIQNGAEIEKRMIQNNAEMERRLMDRTTALIWRLFGAMVALAGLTVAALEYLR